MLDQLFESIDIGIIIFDREYRVTRWNRWLAARTGVSAEEAVGSSVFDLAPTLDASWFRTYCRAVFRFGTYAFLSQKLHRFCIPIEASGSQRRSFAYMQQNCTLGPLRNDGNEIAGAFLTVQDVTELAEYELRLAELAERDGLTGAYNRYFLDRLMESEFARHRRYRRALSVVMVDLDYFKKVNDTFGHAAGDVMLKSVSEALSKRLREADTLCRYGGEEFCVVLPETDAERSVHVGEELRHIVETLSVRYGSSTISATASVGVATVDATTGHATARELIKEADASLYRAKRTGRNRVVHAQTTGA